MRAQWTAGVSSIFCACAFAELVALSSIDIVAHRIASDEARLVARQGIADHRIGTLMLAALSHDGRLIAFVSRSRRGSARDCCQDLYTLDRSTGLTTLESIGLDGSPANADSQNPSLSSDGQILAFADLRLEPRRRRLAVGIGSCRRARSSEQASYGHLRVRPGSRQR